MATLLIVNPFASGVDEQRLAAVAAALGSPEVVRTSGPGHATALAREALGRVEAIHVFGGDGTFNEVLNGVDATTPLGLVPGGGTSVLPRALGLPRDPVRAAERISTIRSGVSLTNLPSRVYTRSVKRGWPPPASRYSPSGLQAAHQQATPQGRCATSCVPVRTLHTRTVPSRCEEASSGRVGWKSTLPT